MDRNKVKIVVVACAAITVGIAVVLYNRLKDKAVYDEYDRLDCDGDGVECMSRDIDAVCR